MPPIVLRIMPTGICPVVSRILEIVSETVRSDAPMKEHEMNSRLCSYPTKLLPICGAIRPTKPINPATHTADDAARIPTIAKNIFHFSTDTPNAFAFVSPRSITFNGL